MFWRTHAFINLKTFVSMQNLAFVHTVRLCLSVSRVSPPLLPIFGLPVPVLVSSLLVPSPVSHLVNLSPALCL